MCVYDLLLCSCPRALICFRYAGRNQVYLDLAINYTIDLMRDAFLLNWAPSVVRPYVFELTRLDDHVC